MPISVFQGPRGNVFNYPVSSVTLSTAGPTDIFCITAGSNTRVAINEIRIGQFTEFGDAQAELLSVTMLNGSTSISGGTVIAAFGVRSHTGAATAGTSVSGPSTTIASSASASLSFADSYNVAAGFYYKPDENQRIIIEPGSRWLLRQSTPNDPITYNAMLILEEIGRS